MNHNARSQRHKEVEATFISQHRALAYAPSITQTTEVGQTIRKTRLAKLDLIFIHRMDVRGTQGDESYVNMKRKRTFLSINQVHTTNMKCSTQLNAYIMRVL